MNRTVTRTLWLVGVMLLMLQGCNTTTVKPWERGTLAREEMAFVPDSLESKFQDHIHFSKEAAQMVGAGSGGGCGCN